MPLSSKSKKSAKDGAYEKWANDIPLHNAFPVLTSIIDILMLLTMGTKRLLNKLFKK